MCKRIARGVFAAKGATVKLLVVDGHNLLFQMFFGMPSRIVNSQGVAIHGVLGFVGALNKILDALCPTHVVVLFDGERHNPRCDVDENYKANRTDYSQVEESENPFSQLPHVYSALDFMQIAHVETETCETDDVVASYVKNYRDVCEIVIASFDSDYFQLVDDNVSVFRYRGKNSVLCTKSYVQKRYGVQPCEFAHFKSLAGDASDNVRGVKGIGPKRAAALLQRFGTVQNLCEHAEQVENATLRQSICQSKAQIFRNFSLINLQGNEPLPFEMCQLLLKTRKKTMEVVRGIGL